MKRFDWQPLSPIEQSGRVAIVLLFAVMSLVGADWGLPTRAIDRYLFGRSPAWKGADIYRLAGAAGKFTPGRGADVDADPRGAGGDRPVNLTETAEDVARIYLRYRLYTYQPDEMITMMALGGMDPARLDLDPRLYQYGGLFIYPTGALIGVCGALGLIDVRGDVVYYLDNPDEFGKFYVVARMYAAAWGILGVLVVFAITRRLAGDRSALIAALLFTLMPVVVSMAHEGKPHLPGAVLMLTAVLLAGRYLDRLTPVECTGRRPVTLETTGVSSQPAIRSTGRTRDWWLMCACCGAALGMVLSSWPVFILIPLVAFLDQRRGSVAPPSEGLTNSERPAADCPNAEPGANATIGRRNPGAGLIALLVRTIAGAVLALAVYLVANPYIVINLFLNRGVLQSNFGNSLAMYQIARIGEGVKDVVRLTIEGATLPILVVGLAGLVGCIIRRSHRAIPLVIVATVFFLQFVLIGAGKPAEYGRFGVFTNTALAIGAAAVLGHRWNRRRDLINMLPVIVVVVWAGIAGMAYLANLRIDAVFRGSRIRFAEVMRSDGGLPNLAVFGEPAPYCCPPIDFSRTDVYLYRSFAQFAGDKHAGRTVLLYPADSPSDGGSAGSSPGVVADLGLGLKWPGSTPISWANKPFFSRDHTHMPAAPPPPASDWLSR